MNSTGWPHRTRAILDLARACLSSAKALVQAACQFVGYIKNRVFYADLGMLARIDGRVPVVLFYKLRVTWTNPMVVELGQNASSWNVAALRAVRRNAGSLRCVQFAATR